MSGVQNFELGEIELSSGPDGNSMLLGSVITLSDQPSLEGGPIPIGSIHVVSPATDAPVIISSVQGDPGVGRFGFLANGLLVWAGDSGEGDTFLYRSGVEVLRVVGALTIDTELVVGTKFSHQGTQAGFFGHAAVAQPTGWGDPTGAVDRTTFDTATVTTEELAQRLAAFILDHKSIGLLGA